MPFEKESPRRSPVVDQFQPRGGPLTEHIFGDAASGKVHERVETRQAVLRQEGGNSRLTVRRPPSHESNARLFTQHLFKEGDRLLGVPLDRHVAGLLPAAGRHALPLGRREREVGVQPLRNFLDGMNA